MASFDPVRPDISIPSQEESVLSFWKKEKIFEKSVDRTRDRPFFSFYDGPPFATGLPHYGHLIGGFLKDLVPRYWTMRGYHVPRRFGWDCHGLPVEYEINKSLKVDSRKQILEMGIGKYNDACRGIVKRYTAEWRITVERMGRWVDMDHAYYTMDPSFMQSVWWVFKKLFEQGLVYEGYKVVPYSVGVSTPLSNFEANLNYKDVQDPAITVILPLEKNPNVAFLAWTTTPWTLPSNLALAVGADIDYVRVKTTEKIAEKNTDTEREYWLAEARMEAVFGDLKKNPEKVTVLETLKGNELVRKYSSEHYVPLFPYFKSKKSEGAFRVILASHVTTESGTGIVHMAPAFGEEDFTACKENGVPLVNPVDDDGMFTAQISDYAGKRVKEADKEIIARLKAEKTLFKQETIMHSYPFCWRSDTPLIYRAVETWFVKLDPIKEKLLKNNSKTRWVPDHLRDGRFGKWLENARDWAISRNRFWGTPLPVWKNPEGEVLCAGSMEELSKWTGKKISDIHLENVIDLTIPSPTGKSPLKHVGSVLDCWFESGSMPYAQGGYPFQGKEEFEKGYPAEFIAEGLDQTRGWFYTLMVIATALFDKPAFKNVIVNGLVLAEDGKKMSKSLRNYPDPAEVLNEHGADALRLYLIQSPAVRAQDLRFSEAGVREIVRKILLRWWNSYSFFVNYANVDRFQPRGDSEKSPNILDVWILSRLHSLIDYTNREMEAYRVYNVVPRLLSFVEELTNTYIRFNRKHFWQDGMPEEKRLAYETLYEVLHTFSKVMAPFAPYLSETMYQNLKKSHGKSLESVHLESYPTSKAGGHEKLEQAVSLMDELVTMARNLREKIGVKAKIPLRSIRIIQRDAMVLAELKKLEPYFIDEINVREVIYDPNEDQYVRIFAKANFPVLGKRLGKKMKQTAAAIEALSTSDLLKLENLPEGETMLVDGETITLSDLEIRRSAKKESDHFLTSRLLSIDLDPTVTPEQIEEGKMRELIRCIQATRKAADLKLDQRIEVTLDCEEKARNGIQALIDRFGAHIQTETLAKKLGLVVGGKMQDSEFSQETDFDEGKIRVGIRSV